MASATSGVGLVPLVLPASSVCQAASSNIRRRAAAAALTRTAARSRARCHASPETASRRRRWPRSHFRRPGLADAPIISSGLAGLTDGSRSSVWTSWPPIDRAYVRPRLCGPRPGRGRTLAGYPRASSRGTPRCEMAPRPPLRERGLLSAAGGDARQHGAGGFEQPVPLDPLDERLAQERLVGGVLEQAPDEVRHAGEELAVGRVDADWAIPRDEGLLDRLGHAVEHLGTRSAVSAPGFRGRGHGVSHRADVVAADAAHVAGCCSMTWACLSNMASVSHFFVKTGTGQPSGRPPPSRSPSTRP